MDFIDQVQELATRTAKLKAHLTTEEATKTALVLPFLQTLGFDVFNPKEVFPEFVADHDLPWAIGGGLPKLARRCRANPLGVLIQRIIFFLFYQLVE